MFRAILSIIISLRYSQYHNLRRTGRIPRVIFASICPLRFCSDIVVRGIALEHWKALLWQRRIGLLHREKVSQPPQHPRCPVKLIAGHPVSRYIEILIVGTRQDQAFTQAGGVVGANVVLLHGASEH